MSDVSGAAPAAAEPTPAPAASPPPSLPEKPSASPREAVDRAFAGLEHDEPAQPPRPVQSTTQPVDKPEKAAKPPDRKGSERVANPQTKAEPKETGKLADEKLAERPVSQPARTPTGQFAPASPHPGELREAGEEGAAHQPAAPSAYPEPPKRFSEDARAAWNDAPEPVRAEIHRATRELEQGIQKYRADAEAYEPVRAFDDLAKKTGTTLQAAMSKYVAIEQKLRTDFVGGLDELCRNRGITLRGLAERLLQQPPNQQAERQDQVVAGLHQKISQLEEQIGGVSKTIETQRSDATVSEVQSFASEAGHERFEDLAEDIAMFLKTGRANDLQQAYELAERLNPAQSRAPAQPAAASTGTPAAQTRKGTLSVNGAPSSGSDPATKKPPATPRAAVDDAFARVGIG